jgi:glycosyltransferase involved in cell wall biosynthesis
VSRGDCGTVDEFVSIVVATKNSLPRLRRLVDHWRQSRPEAATLVIVDGDSTDGTGAWLNALAPDGRGEGLRWLSRPDTGIADAWNRGVEQARGDWVVFLGADDLPAEPDGWRHAIATLKALPGACALAAFPVAVVSPAGAPIDVQSPELGPGNEAIFAINTLPHQGLFHRRGIWQRLGGFDASYRIACDYDFAIRALVAGEMVRLCPGPPPVRMTFGGASKLDPTGNLLEFRRIQIAHRVRRFRLRWWLAWIRGTVRGVLRPVIGDARARRLADATRRLRGLPRAWTVP